MKFAGLFLQASETEQRGLIVDFINDTDLDSIIDKTGIIEAFFEYAQDKAEKRSRRTLANENLNKKEAKRYLRYL